LSVTELLCGWPLTAFVFDDTQNAAQRQKLQEFCEENARLQETCYSVYKKKSAAAAAAFNADDIVVLVPYLLYYSVSILLICLCLWPVSRLCVSVAGDRIN